MKFSIQAVAVQNLLPLADTGGICDAVAYHRSISKFTAAPYLALILEIPQLKSVYPHMESKYPDPRSSMTVLYRLP